MITELGGIALYYCIYITLTLLYQHSYGKVPTYINGENVSISVLWSLAPHYICCAFTVVMIWTPLLPSTLSQTILSKATRPLVCPIVLNYLHSIPTCFWITVKASCVILKLTMKMLDLNKKSSIEVNWKKNLCIDIEVFLSFSLVPSFF